MDLNKERKSKNSIKSPLEIRSLYILLSVFYIWKSVRSQNFPFLSLWFNRFEVNLPTNRPNTYRYIQHF